MNILNFLPSLSTLLLLGIAAGGFLLAMRQGYAKQAGKIEARVIAALQAQNEAQEKQIMLCEKEIVRLKRLFTTVQYALNRRGLSITHDNESITLIDDQSKNTYTVQIRTNGNEPTQEEM